MGIPSPERVLGLTADVLSSEEVRTMVSTGRVLEILEIEVVADASVVGHTLDAVGLPIGSLVISDRRRRRVAQSDTELAPGERYLVTVESGDVDEILALFRG